MPTLTPIAKIEKFVKENKQNIYTANGNILNYVRLSDLLPFLQSLKAEEKQMVQNAFSKGYNNNTYSFDYFTNNYTQEVTT
jgi:hypothetical protein